MSNLLADLSNSFTDDAEPEETPEAEPEETPEAEAPEGEPEETADDEEAPEETDEIPEIDPDATYRVGDETLTGEELKNQRLMQADYTRKTQELSALRKQVETERAELTQTQEDNEEFREWIASFNDVAAAEMELTRYFPKTAEALREKWINEAIEEAELPDAARRDRAGRRKAELELYARQKIEDAQGRKAQKAEQARKTAEMRQTFDGWLKEVFTESGLNPENAKHQRLVRNEISSAYRNQTWTKDSFATAARTVADALGVVKKKAAEKPAAKLPPVKPQGNKAPAPAKKAQKSVKKSAHTEDFFAKLRRGEY